MWTAAHCGRRLGLRAADKSSRCEDCHRHQWEEFGLRDWLSCSLLLSLSATVGCLAVVALGVLTHLSRDGVDVRRPLAHDGRLRITLPLVSLLPSPRDVGGTLANTCAPSVPQPSGGSRPPPGPPARWSRASVRFYCPLGPLGSVSDSLPVPTLVGKLGPFIPNGAQRRHSPIAHSSQHGDHKRQHREK